jgi:hypothetical protein
MFARCTSTSMLCFLTMIAAPSLAVGAADARDLDRAESISKRALKLYEQGRFAEAADLFMDAHRLSEEPIQLRNAAKASELAGAFEAALERWRRYRTLAADDPEGEAEAEAHIRAIRARTTVVRVVAPVEAPQLIEPLRVESTWRTPVAYTLLGTSLVAAAGSVYAWISATRRLSTLRGQLAVVDGAGRVSGISSDDANAELADINSERRAGLFIACGAIAAMATGLLLLLFSDS